MVDKVSVADVVLLAAIILVLRVMAKFSAFNRPDPPDNVVYI